MLMGEVWWILYQLKSMFTKNAVGTFPIQDFVCESMYMYEFSASGRDNTVRKAAFTETLIEFYYQFQISYLSLKFHNVTY